MGIPGSLAEQCLRHTGRVRRKISSSLWHHGEVLLHCSLIAQMPQHPCKEVNHSTCQHRNHGGNQTLPYFIPSSALTAGMDEETPPRGVLEGSASTGAPVTGSFLKLSSPPAAARVTRRGLQRRPDRAGRDGVDGRTGGRVSPDKPRGPEAAVWTPTRMLVLLSTHLPQLD